MCIVVNYVYIDIVGHRSITQMFVSSSELQSHDQILRDFQHVTIVWVNRVNKTITQKLVTLSEIYLLDSDLVVKASYIHYG